MLIIRTNDVVDAQAATLSIYGTNHGYVFRKNNAFTYNSGQCNGFCLGFGRTKHTSL